MSDQEHIELSAKQTPLPDLLDRVPDDIVLGIPGDEPVFPSYTNIPIGKHARQAAAELRRLSIENDALGLHLSERMKDLARVEAQRNALLGLLKEARKIIRATSSRNLVKDWDQRTTAAIKAVGEGK